MLLHFSSRVDQRTPHRNSGKWKSYSRNEIKCTSHKRTYDHHSILVCEFTVLSASTNIKFFMAPSFITCYFCSHSCGYQKAFNEYAQILKERYPNLIIHGEYYEPSGMYTLLARFLVIFFHFILFFSLI